MLRDLPAPKQAARLGLYAIGLLAVLGFVFLWSGIYSVAASRGHWAIMEWLLTFAMRNSVKTHALGIDAPPLNDPDLATLGAAHFHSGCAFCHGAPGMPVNPIAHAMLPPPPNLAHMRQWRDRELFWIVKNGIKYTGMPAWAAQQRDDEVWALVAFLRRLPALDQNGYRELALGNLKIPPQSGREVATSETTSAAVGACARCHGAEQSTPRSALVPILHGQPPEFLILALEAYAGARRASGIMQPVASDLARDELDRVARYYAGLRPPAPRNAQTDDAAIERGRLLAERGDPSAKVPPCVDCHGATALRIYPRLAGQNLPYMRNRLRLWKNGRAAGSENEAIMAPIAAALSERQIDDVAAYFASTGAAPSAAPR
jgi:cytochrome c553